MSGLRALLDAASARLAVAGVPSARHDAEALAAHVLGIPPARLGLAGDMDAGQAGAYEQLVAERARRVPLQHLLGTAAFRHLTLAVGPGVFVPRPETEVLVDWAIDVLRTDGRDAPVVVDLCAGSGAIALSVAHEVPGARVYAVEHAPAALAWLRRNAAARAAAGDPPVCTVAGDATAPATLAAVDGTVDLVLANPPYVPDGMLVEPEVADHDPPEALWGGPDGLGVVRGVARQAAVLLRPGGHFGIEHANVQGAALGRLLARPGDWDDVACHPDLAGRERFTTARRRAR